jgi:TonB family protein
VAVDLSPERERQPFPLYPFLALSLVTHVVLLAWLGRARLSLDASPVSPPPIVVDLAQPQEQPKPPPTQIAKQIVAPSDRENELPPLGPAYLSDRDNRVEKETIRRGNPDAGRPQAKQSQPAPKPAPPPVKARAPQRQAPRTPTRPKATRGNARSSGSSKEVAPPLPGLDRLLPPAGAVLARAGVDQGDEGAKQRAQEADPHRDLTSAPPPAPGLFNGLRGTYDDLPDVAAGQLTMLNTKADRFAPFVRRVGTRVFQNMLIYQRRDLDIPDILAASEAVTVRATLDKTGKLKSLDVADYSGSSAMDRTLIEALRQAAFDPNPPSGAANEQGEFEFLFQAQIVASLGPGGGPSQVRGIESRLRVGLL